MSTTENINKNTTNMLRNQKSSNFDKVSALFGNWHYLPRAFPKSAQRDRIYVPLEHVTRNIKFCL